MTEQERKQEIAADVLLEKSGIGSLDMARVALELSESLPEELREQGLTPSLCRQIIQLGADSLKQEAHTVTFREAVEKSLISRAERRTRTLAEIRQYCRRFVRNKPFLPGMSIRRISSELCRDIIMNNFHTPSTQCKARRLLHAIFVFCQRRGWCSDNPVLAVDVPYVKEKPIRALTLPQVRRLLATVRQPQHLPCAAAVGFMLWAGIRPTEVTRLRWRDVRVEDHSIIVEARHSKTGGARQVKLYPVLIKWLQENSPFRLPGALIVPSSWVRRWRALRVAAGFHEWNPDTLRHTFASYHLKHFSNLRLLQIDMGHADIQMLRTRYLDMRGITRSAAAEFWGEPGRQRRNTLADGGLDYS